MKKNNNQEINYYDIPQISINFQDNFITCKRDRVTDVESAVEVFEKVFDSFMEHHEECWAMYCNANGNVIGLQQIAKGGHSETQVDRRIVLQGALMCNATCVFICHNHPTDSSQPSDGDVIAAKNTKAACEAAGIALYDDIIICAHSYCSLKQCNML